MFKTILKQNDRKNFILAMLKEIDAHKSCNHWTLMRREDIGSEHRDPKTGKLIAIMAIWSFKCKLSQDGRLMKHRTCLCVRGGMQQWGVNYWETYAPVVNWISVQTLLAIASIHQLETRLVDFLLAFLQANLDVNIFMKLPMGMEISGGGSYIPKLNKSLYGIKQASTKWFEHLKGNLECDHPGRKFLQLYVDQCML